MNLPAEKSKTYPAIVGVEIQEDSIAARLADGRVIAIPVAWFERLDNATKEQLSHFEISPSGYGIHWPDIDEDISIQAFIDGVYGTAS